jgi:hypothetical protein
VKAADRDKATGTGALTGRDGRAWALAGANSRTAKLTNADVAAIRAAPATVSHAALARRFEVSAAQVSAIRRGLTWRT